MPENLLVRFAHDSLGSSAVQSTSLVTVVIPAFNCADYIGATIESVNAQSFQPAEVIVVDDGSTDVTAEVIKKFPTVRYIRQSNGGPSRARNRGIQEAVGEYIAFLDSDDLWPPDKLRDQVAALESRPEAGLVFGDMRCFADSGQAEPSMFERYGFGAQYFGHPQRVVDAVPKLLAMNFIPTGTVMARKQTLVEAGLFDERQRLVEDWDLWLRVALRCPIAYSTKVWKLKRLHSNNLSRDTEAMSKAALHVLEKFQAGNRDELERRGIDVGRHLREGYKNLGYFYLRRSSLGPARAWFYRSLALGIQARVIFYFISTFLGRRFVSSLVRVRG